MMKKQMDKANCTAESRSLAERAATERLLNTYMRETGVFDPSWEEGQGLLPAALAEKIQREGIPMRLELPLAGTAIVGAIAYLSPFGHHRYGGSFWLAARDHDSWPPIGGAEELGRILLEELAAAQDDATDKSGSIGKMLDYVRNSVEKTAYYAERHLMEDRSLGLRKGEDRFSAAEQSLVFGHPFHPNPKSSEGFSSDDLDRYAPEMGASFALHYFAAAPELMTESLLGVTEEELIPREAIEGARKLLGPFRQDYRLLPCHPWQAAFVKQWAEVQAALESGKLIDLGPLGQEVYPTSSVRTVWDPSHGYFFKLPLNVRITNFVRVNPPEQVERTVDASRALGSLSGSLPFKSFTILPEAGYRTLYLPGASAERLEQIAESFAVIFRANPVVRPAAEDTPAVVAGLLEKPPAADVPPLIEAVRRAAGSPERWLVRYAEISLIPLLWLFMEHGASIEAHVQNSMVTLENGWPAHFYVRDLEGVSISRERAEAQDYFGRKLAKDSPVLYHDQEAWHRFKYYVIVNHLGHLLHTLAFYEQRDERELWQVVAEAIRTSEWLGKDAYRPYLTDLMESESLPAKANLISCFQKRGEKPLYVSIPNLLVGSGVAK